MGLSVRYYYRSTFNIQPLISSWLQNQGMFQLTPICNHLTWAFSSSIAIAIVFKKVTSLSVLTPHLALLVFICQLNSRRNDNTQLYFSLNNQWRSNPFHRYDAEGSLYHDELIAMGLSVSTILTTMQGGSGMSAMMTVLPFGETSLNSLMIAKCTAVLGSNNRYDSEEIHFNILSGIPTHISWFKGIRAIIDVV